MNQAKINFSVETVVIPENDFGKNLIFRNISVFPVARIKRGVAVVAHYFMMGDNRNSSNDSRFWTNHFVSRDKIIAKALFCYYPSIHLIK